MVSWCTWNVRGLNSPIKCRAVKDFLAVSTVGFCCILETRVREENFVSISRRFGDSWGFISNYSNSGVGRMWIMWKRNRFVFTTNEVVDQFISGVITDLISGEKVEVLCVYASNSNIKRRVLWRRMAEISAGWRGPGMVLGDFNTIRLHSEAFGGAPNVEDMEEFDMAIREADLVEPAVQGNWFTWTSKIHGLGLMKRLDRILVNDEGLSTWPNMRVNVLPWGISDHSPILVYPSNQRSQQVVSFRFFNHWVEEASFMDVVSSAWTKDTRVSPIVNIVRNLRNLKSILRRHFGRHIRTISEDVRLANDTMDRA